MSKRRYAHIQKILPEIKEMIANGRSHREIEEFYGLKGDRPVHNLLKRKHRKEARIAEGIVPHPKGRPQKDAPPRDIVAEQADESSRLKMKNKLFRDFLQFTKRM